LFYLGWIWLGSVQTRTQAAVGVWIGEQILLGFLGQFAHFSSVAFWAHVGGFGMGMLMAGLFIWIMPKARRRAAETGDFWYNQEKFNKESDDLTQLKL
jgi:membrane associated rhomboid family serine protease